MPKIGFMFGAGAEISYGLPTGGDFALNIFRQDVTESKNDFRSQRDAIDGTSLYAQWLPEGYESKSISSFRKKAYEDIIRSTVEQNRDNIIERLNSLDLLANDIVHKLILEGIDINADFEEMNGRPVSNSFMSRTISFVDEFRDGNQLFGSTYFSALLLAYKALKKKLLPESIELAKVIIAILQLQIGALGERLSRKINDGVFDKKDDDIDILDDLGDIIQLNYQAVGLSGLEYLLEIQKPSVDTVERRILLFAQMLIEKIYSCVLDYKSLIDSNWMYLYHPKNEWGKFCKISIFLLNVQKYINNLYSTRPIGKDGYYDDIAEAVKKGKIEIAAVGTSNYAPLIADILDFSKVTYLNGSTNLWYDPYLNHIGERSQLNSDEAHFVVPLMFTQSGTKPMISIDMSSQYVEYYRNLENVDEICVIGFGFNSDDEHINGLFRDLIDRKGKSMTVVRPQSVTDANEYKKDLARRLKIKNTAQISVIEVDNRRCRHGVNWIDCLIASIEEK